MARLLSGLHDSIYLGGRRNPKVKALLFDQTDTFSDICLGKAQQTPFDLSDYVTNIGISEEEGRGTTCNITIMVEDLEYISPYHFVGRRVLRVIYIDTQIEEQDEDWISLFTGVCVGQPGFRRVRGESYQIDLSCVDRSYYYSKQKLQTTKYGRGLDIGSIAVDIATNETYGFGLEREECKFGLFRSVVDHTEVSFYETQMMEGLELIGFIVDKKPAWDGDGHLCMRSTDIDKVPIRKYVDDTVLLDITWPQSDTNLYNSIKIVGLSSSLSKITSPIQEVVSISGTVGYFQEEFRKRVWFSADQQGRVSNVFVSEKNINGMLGGIFGGGNVKIKSVTEFGCIIIVDCPYMAWIFIIFFITYIAFFIVGAIFQMIQSAMLIAAAIWMCLGMLIMQQMGTFEVTLSGTPYKMVYKEIEGRAEWANLLPYETNQKTIENHLVYNQDMADEIALRELKREKIKGCMRSFTIPHDPVLEWGDVIELADGSRYYIYSISKSFVRGEPQNMNISAYIVRSGKEYSGEEGFSIY